MSRICVFTTAEEEKIDAVKCDLREAPGQPELPFGQANTKGRGRGGWVFTAWTFSMHT